MRARPLHRAAIVACMACLLAMGFGISILLLAAHICPAPAMLCSFSIKTQRRAPTDGKR